VDINNLPFNSENFPLYLMRWFCFRLMEWLPLGHWRPSWVMC